MVRSSDSPAKWIGLVEQQRTFSGDVRAAADHRRNRTSRPVEPAKACIEPAADHAFLNPVFTLAECAIRRETGEFRAGARATGRTVVSLAGAQHEVATVRARG